MNRTYTCAACGGTFEAGWSEEEARAESRDLWGNVPESELAVICDGCFQRGKDAALAEHKELGRPQNAAEYERAVRRAKR